MTRSCCAAPLTGRGSFSGGCGNRISGPQGLERERNEAVYAASADRQALEEMEEYEREREAHRGTRRLVIRLGLSVVALLVVVGLLIWRLFT